MQKRESGSSARLKFDAPAIQQTRIREAQNVTIYFSLCGSASLSINSQRNYHHIRYNSSNQLFMYNFYFEKLFYMRTKCSFCILFLNSWRMLWVREIKYLINVLAALNLEFAANICREAAGAGTGRCENTQEPTAPAKRVRKVAREEQQFLAR